jgi:uncharacterized membrane protein YkvA (DUF1232 family)
MVCKELSMMRLMRRLRAAGRHLLVAWYAWRHPDLRWPDRLMLVAIALYLFSPVDLIPDSIPLLGWLDDFAVITFLLPHLLKILPAAVLQAAKKKAGDLH